MRVSLVILAAGCESKSPTGSGSTPNGTPTKLAFAAQPASALVGAPLSPAVQIAVLDAQGNTAAG